MRESRESAVKLTRTRVWTWDRISIKKTDLRGLTEVSSILDSRLFVSILVLPKLESDRLSCFVGQDIPKGICHL